jgi:hypothetical protein
MANLSSHKIIYSPYDSSGQLLYTLNHLRKQQKESSKYEDHVIDYDGTPLSSQTKNQIQQTKVPIPRTPSVAEQFQNQKSKNIIYISILSFLLITFLIHKK